MKIYLNRDWYFTNPSSSGQKVSIPHTCKETPFHYFDESEYQMISSYQKELEIPEEWKNKQVLLTFEGVAHSCEVFLNEEKVGEHRCGYTAFTIPLKNLLYGKKNTLLVKVDSRENQNIPPFGHVVDYMTYGGIYRDVYLKIKEDLYLKDVFVHSDLKNLTLEITCNKAPKTTKDGLCRVSMRKKGEEHWKALGTVTLQKEKGIFQLKLPHIDLWDITNPHLYEIKVALPTDEKRIVFGFRKMEFKTDGFYLNDKKVKIRGLNRHQSYPYVGYAMPSSMQKLDADILKYELGLNAVRTSHYPQSQAFIDRCDEIGLLVFTEIPGWQYIGDEEWKAQACQNVKDMVLQYRNHPSIMLWGVRINESPDDDTFYTQTNKIAHELDPTRPTGGVRNIKKGHFQEDVYTYNDFSHEGYNAGCEPKAKISPDRKKAYLVTEYNGHMFPTKSFDCEPHRMQHALRHATVLQAVENQEDIAGSFGWCMADYNTHKDFGSGDRICYHGVLDMFRNPKMAAAVYASKQEKIPVLETSSGMEIGEYPASTLGTPYIFTNADSVRMYKNGKFIKEYKSDSSHQPIPMDDQIGELLMTQEGFTKEQADATKYILLSVAKYGVNHLPMQAFLKMPKLMLKYKMTIEQVTALYTKYIGNWGELSVTYQFDALKDGKLVKSIVKAPMKQARLQVTADHTTLTEDYTYDVALVRIQMVNEYGALLPYSHEPIFLKTKGPLEIIGPHCISLQGGMFGTYVKSTGCGEATLILRDTRNQEVTIDFQIKKAGE